VKSSCNPTYPYPAILKAHFFTRSSSRLFKGEAHYRDFLALVEESLERAPMRILAYCLMPSHGHWVL
jgi:REP element-mobilizing transposase RayT